jgi:DNA-binding CsgD family transcriptional regulator
MPNGGVIGRDEELGSVRTFLAEVDRWPAALLVSGEPGIGKSILWEAGVAAIRDSEARPLLHRSVEAEAQLSFTGLSDLLAPVFDEVAPSLPPLRREALEVALLLAAPADTPPDARAIGLALLDVLRALELSRPVVLALDDAQWLDPASAAVLQIALRRLTVERVGLLASVRATAGTTAPLELERTFRDESLRRVPLGPLSLAALHHLLRDRLDLELTRPELVRLEAASGGNPFFALELGRELIRTSTRPAAGRALPVPERLQDLLGGRLSRLPAQTGDVLLAVAALARPTVDGVVDALGDRERVVDALEVAVREGVVEFDESRLRFSHPLLASLCYTQAAPWKRRQTHEALAGVVADVEERARHLALAADGPDAVVASALDAAATQAQARGATAAGAELSELAADLTPDDPVQERARRFRAAHLHRLAGDTEKAHALLTQLLAEAPPGRERADILFALARTLRGDIRRNLELCSQALSEVGNDDERALQILAFRSINHLIEADVRAALADARMALEKAELLGDPAMLARAIARAGTAEVYAVEITPGLLERGAEIEERLGLTLEYFESPRVSLARLLMRLGELERAAAILEDLERKAAARGDEFLRVSVLFNLTMVAWLSGDWQRALEHTDAARELAEQIQGTWLAGQVGRFSALIEVDLGLVERARASCEEALSASRASSNEFWTLWTQGVLGRLELALGNLEAAAGDLRDLPRQLLDTGLNDPANTAWADAIETLIASGELESARSYLEQHERYARRLGSAYVEAGVARCRGLLAAAEGDSAAALDAFGEALALLPDFPFERARTLLCLGVVRRQAQQRAASREALDQALAIFDRLGARLWADKARAELRRISGRAPAPDALTGTETRVAELAVRGRTNREIAAELFMGVSTVEAHLARVYRKLGIRSRAGLPTALATIAAGDGAQSADRPSHARRET